MIINILALIVPGGLIAWAVYHVVRRLVICEHDLTFPITSKVSRQTHRTCVKCGKEYEYDFLTMKVGKEIHGRHRYRPARTGVIRVGFPVPEIQGGLR